MALTTPRRSAPFYTYLLRATKINKIGCSLLQNLKPYKSQTGELQTVRKWNKFKYVLFYCMRTFCAESLHILDSRQAVNEMENQRCGVKRVTRTGA